MNRFATAFWLAAWACVAWPDHFDGTALLAEERGKAEGVVVELWPGKAPDETAVLAPEKVLLSPKLDRKQVEVTEPTRMVTNVSKPTIAIYRPAKAKDTGTAALICQIGRAHV